MLSARKSFQFAMIISVTLHLGVFLPQLKFFAPENQIKKFELTYVKNKEKEGVKVRNQLPKRDIDFRQKHLVRMEPNAKITLSETQDSLFKSTAPKPLAPDFLKEKWLEKYDEFLKNKPQLSRPDVIAIKKKIALTPVELDKISNPSYISYYQIVREKIRRCAYQNYTSQQTGEVYLSFVISTNGALLKAMIIEEKSTPNNYLKDIALRSIKSASGFPAFPKDLDYPQLTFNVIISFEVE